MFGLGSSKAWGTFAYGKHHSYGDFIEIGVKGVIPTAFTQWVKNGVREIDIHTQTQNRFRFWARGPNNELVCGIVTNSSDSFKRCYPFISAGFGIISGWEKNWELLPFFADKNWMKIEEYLAVINNYQEFRKKIVVPLLTDSDFKSIELLKKKLKRPDSESINKSIHKNFLHKLNNLDGLSREDIFTIPLGDVNEIEFFFLSHKVHELYKKRSSIPHAMFMGGEENKKIVFINRKLTVKDFKYLWLNEKKEYTNGSD